LPAYLDALPSSPSAPLFPYTTLFRSPYCNIGQHMPLDRAEQLIARFLDPFRFGQAPAHVETREPEAADVRRAFPADMEHVARLRSEEHTSELQSRENLVCRLLLEKKK